MVPDSAQRTFADDPEGVVLQWGRDLLVPDRRSAPD